MNEAIDVELVEVELIHCFDHALLELGLELAIDLRLVLVGLLVQSLDVVSLNLAEAFGFAVAEVLDIGTQLKGIQGQSCLLSCL
jgi:hypothetical protein